MDVFYFAIVTLIDILINIMCNNCPLIIDLAFGPFEQLIYNEHFLSDSRTNVLPAYIITAHPRRDPFAPIKTVTSLSFSYEHLHPIYHETLF